MREILRDLKETLRDSAKPERGDASVYPRGAKTFGRGPYSPRTQEKPKNFKYGDLKLLLPYMKPHWRLGSVAGLIALASTFVTTLIPLSFKFLADDAVLAGNHRLLNIIIGFLIGAVAFIAVADFFSQVLFFRFQQEVVFSVQSNLFSRLLHLPKAFFDSNSTGYLMSRVAGDVFQLQAFVSMNIVEVLAKSVQLVFAVGILLYLNWKLTLLSLAVMPLFVLVARVLSGKTRRASRAALEKTALVSNDLQERLSGAALIKAFAAEDREARKILRSLRNAFEANQKRIVVTSGFSLLSSLINTLGLSIVLWYGAVLIIDKQLTPGELLAFSVYLGFLTAPAKFFANLSVTLQQSFAALERVFELLSLVPEHQTGETKIKVSKIDGEVRFDEVSFSYDRQQLALEQVSFVARPGQLVAIVGPSGAGKSTLVNLIISLYQPGSGQIYFDKVPITELNLQSLRERVGIVSQEIFLFNDSIKSNICYGRLDASDEEVREAARLAAAHEFISQLPDGYETDVGEKGVNLSVGQKQRLSIARAILKSPDILIFDEATSALDPLTERTIQSTLQAFKGRRTIFAVAHRLTTVAMSDFILVLDKGRVVQSGTHKELWGQEGLYRELCRTQFIHLDAPAAQPAWMQT